MEIKIVKDAPFTQLGSGALDIKNMLRILFNEGDLHNDAIYLDTERVFKNRTHEQPFPNEGDVYGAVNAIRTNCIRFAKEITSEHKISIIKVTDDNGNFGGIYIKLKTIGDK